MAIQWTYRTSIMTLQIRLSAGKSPTRIELIGIKIKAQNVPLRHNSIVNVS